MPLEGIGSDSLKQASALFVDQTAQLGGAELCLLDTVTLRQHPEDRVLLFQDGPLGQTFLDRGVRVQVAPMSDRGATVRKQSGALQKLRATRDLYKLARRVAAEAKQVDVIYANTAKAMVVGSIASWYARKPLVYHLHDILSAQHFSASNRLLLGTLAQRATRVIVNSNATAESLCSLRPRMDRSRIVTVYNGICPEPFDRALTDCDRLRNALRSELGIGNEPLVGLFGRLSPWKGQALAIEALRSLPGVHLMLVGAALFGESDYEQQLRALCQAEELSKRVHWLGFRSNVAELMVACDAVLHCSTAPEPFGRVIVESMLARRPVVASSAGGACEIVDADRTGVLFTPGSAQDLASALRRTLNGGENIRKMVDLAMVEARQRFDPVQRTDDISRVIDHAARSR